MQQNVYCVQLIFLVNMHGLFLWKTKEKLVLSIYFKVFKRVQREN